VVYGGRCRIRTCDFHRVKVAKSTFVRLQYYFCLSTDVLECPLFLFVLNNLTILLSELQSKKVQGHPALSMPYVCRMALESSHAPELPNY
jgi:hypothetical protein